MNRKQEIAAWLLGLLIALGLLVTDNGIWALFVLAGLTIVLAGLTILSLRDRHKKKQKVTEALPPSPTHKDVKTAMQYQHPELDRDRARGARSGHIS
jgi:hypothetical protein